MSKHKEHKALMGRVKKAVKKTQRKLSEDQFNKELQRTINFLSELKEHMSHLQAKEKAVVKDQVKAATTKPPAAKPDAKPATKPKDKTSPSASKNAVKAAVPAVAKK
jgi:hypothetical protein